MQRQSRVSCVDDVTCRDILWKIKQLEQATRSEWHRGNVIGDVSTSEN
jgi:hypothetical protein